MKSPTQQTLKEMRKRGYLCAITEHWNSFVKRRQDLFGFCDVLAIQENDTVAVQTTSGSNVSARLTKIMQTDGAIRWLQSPNRRVLIHGWAKRGPRGKRKVWTCREVEVTPQMIINAQLQARTMNFGLAISQCAVIRQGSGIVLSSACSPSDSNSVGEG